MPSRLLGWWPRYVAGRVATALGSLAVLAVAGFFLFRVLPGDPARAVSRDRPVNAAQLAHLRAQFGTDRPLAAQFGAYVDRVAHGDLGTSYQYRAPVTELIAAHAGATGYLVGTATVVAAVAGALLGARAGWRPGGAADRLTTGVAVTLWSVPTFWLGLVLMSVLAVGWGPVPGLFPTGGIASPDVSGVLPELLDRLWHLALPCLTLVAVLYAQYVLVMRSSVLAVRGGAYLTTARAKGLRDAAVRRRHAVPNALLPTVTLALLNLGGVVSGAVLVETVFSWPGLGSLFYEALRVPDLPLLQGLFLTFAGSVILMNLLADLAYPLLDPRVRGR